MTTSILPNGAKLKDSKFPCQTSEQLKRNDNRLWQLWSGCHLCDLWHLQWGDQWIYLLLQRYIMVACWINFRSSGSVHITVISNTSFSFAILIEHQVTVSLIQYCFPHLFILWMCTWNIFTFEHSRDLQCYKTIKKLKKSLCDNRTIKIIIVYFRLNQLGLPGMWFHDSWSMLYQLNYEATECQVHSFPLHLISW